MKWNVPPLWEGDSCWIIGGGTSVPEQFGVPENIIKKVCERRMEPCAYSSYMKAIHNKHIIGINNAYTIGKWMDILFFGDHDWYLTHRQKVAIWPGLKITCNPRFANKSKRDLEGIKFMARDSKHREGISTEPGCVSWNRNSGAAAISLAYHLGVKTVYLLGFDMTLGSQAFSHWHGSHVPDGKKARKAPPFMTHLLAFPAIATDAERLGVKIYNVSPESKIDVFEKVSLKEVLG